MRNGMKKSTSILYNCNAMVDGGKLPWAAVFASVFPAVKSGDIQRWAAGKFPYVGTKSPTSLEWKPVKCHVIEMCRAIPALEISLFLCSPPHKMFKEMERQLISHW